MFHVLHMTRLRSTLTGFGEAKAGCSIPVVRLFREQVDRVRFSAARNIRRGLKGVAVRVSYNGITTGFQPVDRGPTPLTRLA